MVIVLCFCDDNDLSCVGNYSDSMEKIMFLTFSSNKLKIDIIT